MERTTLLLQALFAVALAQNVGAQPQPEGPVVPSAPQAASVSDAELDTFVDIYVDLMDTVAKFDGELQLAPNEQAADEVRDRIQAESVAKVASRGWTPEKFNSVTEQINLNPNLAEKAAKLIEEKT
jgi:hypothetical protein